MFTLLNELHIQNDAQVKLQESTLFIHELFQLYYDSIMINESVHTLADKYEEWLSNRNITPEDMGFLIGGLSLLLSKEGRDGITKEDLINIGVQGDLKRAEKIDNVDLNRVIRNQIIHLGKMYAKSLSARVAQAIRERKFDQIRHYILKLSIYVDRIKGTEKYDKMKPTDVKNQRRQAPSLNTVPSAGNQ